MRRRNRKHNVNICLARPGSGHAGAVPGVGDLRPGEPGRIGSGRAGPAGAGAGTGAVTPGRGRGFGLGWVGLGLF